MAHLTSLERTVTLRGGVEIPQLGLGVFQVPPDEAQRVVEDALESGRRLGNDPRTFALSQIR